MEKGLELISEMGNGKWERKVIGKVGVTEQWKETFQASNCNCCIIITTKLKINWLPVASENEESITTEGVFFF